mgnify:CR=1 FL=1
MTGAVISYFGPNQAIREAFKDLKNKTSFEPTDHQDVVATIFAALERAGAL